MFKRTIATFIGAGLIAAGGIILLIRPSSQGEPVIQPILSQSTQSLQSVSPANLPVPQLNASAPAQTVETSHAPVAVVVADPVGVRAASEVVAPPPAPPAPAPVVKPAPHHVHHVRRAHVVHHEPDVRHEPPVHAAWWQFWKR